MMGIPTGVGVCVCLLCVSDFVSDYLGFILEKSQ